MKKSLVSSNSTMVKVTAYLYHFDNSLIFYYQTFIFVSILKNINGIQLKYYIHINDIFMIIWVWIRYVVW